MTDAGYEIEDSDESIPYVYLEDDPDLEQLVEDLENILIENGQVGVKNTGAYDGYIQAGLNAGMCERVGKERLTDPKEAIKGFLYTLSPWYEPVGFEYDEEILVIKKDSFNHPEILKLSI